MPTVLVHEWPETRAEIANPDEYHATLYHFQFGAYGSTHVLVYADGFHDALETAAQYLVDKELFGLCVPYDQYEPGHDCTSGDCDCCTFTDAGVLTAYEWYGGEAGEEIRAAAWVLCNLTDSDEE